MKKRGKKLLAIAGVCALSGLATSAQAADETDTVDGRAMTDLKQSATKEELKSFRKYGDERTTDRGEVLYCSIVSNTKAPPRHETCIDEDGDKFLVDLETRE